LLKSLRELPDYHDEACHDGIAWLLKRELPWRISEDEMPDYPRVLGSPPPQLARQIAMRVRTEVREAIRGEDSDTMPEELLFDALETAASLDAVSAAEWLDAEEIGLLHDCCRRWAATTDDLYDLWRESPLIAAAHFGWADVVEILSDNPAFVTATLQWDTRRLDAGSLAQRLTLISARSLAARFAAYAMMMDVEAEARAAAEEITRVPGNAEFAPSFQQGCEKGLRLGQLKGAIAWMRCRQAGLDQP
jgi:hypothetical protein